MFSRMPLLTLLAICFWASPGTAQDHDGIAKQLPRSTVLEKIRVTGMIGGTAQSSEREPRGPDAGAPGPLEGPLLRPTTVAPAGVRLPSGKHALSFLKDNPALRSVQLQPRRTRSAGAGAGGQSQNAAKIWNRYGGLLEVLAGGLAVEPDAAVAVIAAESGGVAFVKGRPVIRFENHHFWKHWGGNNSHVYHRHFGFSAGKKPWTGHVFRASTGEPWRPVHDGQDREWTVFNFAEKLNQADAVRSTSWGLGQILGSNHGRIGYAYAGAMSASFSDTGAGTHMQVLGLFDFVLAGKGSSRALTAFRKRDWLVFAEEYNGKKNAEVYAKRLSEYYRATRGLIWD